MVEMWKFIEGFEDYQVSTYGRVKRTVDDKILKGSDSYGYNTVRLNKILLSVHILVAKAFCDNPENKPFVDHIDRNRSNNHISNLRFCTREENNRNRSIAKNNKSGSTGVIYHKGVKKWQASISLHKKQIHVGYFKTKEEAIEARKKKEAELFEEFAPNN